MAFTATAVGRVRISGNDANGAFYDPGIASAGTDYSQQDTAQLSLTDLVSANVTTVTSVTGGFTAAMIGNAMYMNGGGATAGYYFIITRVDTNTITVDRAPGTVAAGSGKVGGGAATIKKVSDSANATGDKCVAGNKIYIRGSGSQNPSTDDYTTTSFYTPVSGDATNGYVKFIGENGRPRLSSNGLMFFASIGLWLESLYLSCTSNSNGASGIVNSSNASNIGLVVLNCMIDMNNKTALIGMYLYNQSKVIGTEIYGGTTTPSFSAGCHGLQVNNYDVVVLGCNIHHCRDTGILQAVSTDGMVIDDTVVHHNAGDGIYIATTSTIGTVINRGVVDANGGNGINISSASCLQFLVIENMTITNHTGSGKKGIVSAGTLANNDRMRSWIDYNAFFGNTTDLSGISAGAHDVTLSADPYTNAAIYDYTLNATAGGGAACVSAGYPQTIPGV